MEHYGFWSLIPPVIAILLAIKTRQVFFSLIFGIWLGWIVLSEWDVLAGTLATIQALVDVFKESGNTRTIMFSALVGALIAFIQRSGGVAGFISFMNKRINHLADNDNRSAIIRIQLYAWLTGIVIFVESSITVLTVGALFRPLFDKFKVSREKLAYIADSTSAPVCVLIPFNAWGAFILGLILAQGIADPVNLFVSAYMFNFYPFLAISLVLFTILSQKDFGPMRKAEQRARNEGKVLAEGAQPMITDDISNMKPKENIPARLINMLLPLAVMVLMMPIGLVYSGWHSEAAQSANGFWSIIFAAIGQGSGSSAVLWAVLSALITGGILYRVQGIFDLKELITLAFRGISGLIPVALLMMLAFAIGKVSKDLGAGYYVAEVAKSWLSPALIPLIIFIGSAFIAFSTGTSWGTFAIMIAIALPMAQQMDVHLGLAVSAVLGGGVFGDHCSPISDTTIISSMASASDHIDHVKTQLPYALLMGTITSILYLIVGFSM